MARDVSDSTPIRSRDELVAWLESGAKPASEFRVGTEHEKTPFYRNNLSPVAYDGDASGRGGVEALLKGVASESGWASIEDGGSAWMT